LFITVYNCLKSNLVRALITSNNIQQHPTTSNNIQQHPTTSNSVQCSLNAITIRRQLNLFSFFFDCLLIEKHNVDTSRWIHFLRAISMTTTSGKTKTETKIKYFDDDPYWLDFLFFLKPRPQ